MGDDGCAATFMIQRFKDYYDLDFKASIFTKSSGTLGMVLRFKDMYNYYAFEVSSLPKRVRCIKAVNGKYTVMASIDGVSFDKN